MSQKNQTRCDFFFFFFFGEYIFIIYNLDNFFPYISIHSTLFKKKFFLYWCYIASLLCYSYACLYYHACLHYVNKKWSDKDTDCTCCVYCILQ